jgi:hypothetical protein
VKTFLQCPKYNPQQIKSCSKASVEHYLESGTICSIQNRKLVFQNELEKCDILNMQLSDYLMSLQRMIIVYNSNVKMYISQRTMPSTWSGNLLSVLFKAKKGIRRTLEGTERLYEMKAQIP